MPNARQGSILLFRFRGIDVFLHWSWFVVAAIEISSRGRRYPSIGWNIAEYLALFLVVTLHEFGHAFACRQTGGNANKIVLWPLGGVAYLEPPPRPAATLWSIAAGPLVNLVLLCAAYGLTIWAWHHGWRHAAPNAYKLLWALYIMNFGLLIFNLLPIYPLDGGQILRSLLWFLLGRDRSLKVVTVMGLFSGVGLVALAFRLHSFWIGLISLYMMMNCWTGLQQAQVAEATSRPATSTPPLRGALGEEYTEIKDANIQARVRARHSSKILSLQALGFQHFAYRLEALPAYSAFSRFPLILMMFRKAVLVFPKPARLGIANVLLPHISPNSLAECAGLGIKLYSVFSDGTLLISTNYRSPLVPTPNSQIIKNPHCESVDEAWSKHKHKVEELQAQGLTPRHLTSFADYVGITMMIVGRMVPEA